MSEASTDGRLARGLLLALGAGSLGNGAWMLADTARWFEAIAAETGALNLHLVRDVGAAFAAAGVALVWAALRPAVRGPLAAVAGVFLGVHAAIHVAEVASGGAPLEKLLSDLPGVHLPALVVLALAAASLRRRAAEVS